MPRTLSIVRWILAAPVPCPSALAGPPKVSAHHRDKVDLSFKLKLPAAWKDDTL